MNEQDIRKAVSAVLKEMKTVPGQSKAEHICDCRKNRMTLKAANLLIEKVKAKAKEMGVNAVIAVSDKAGRPVCVQCMDDSYIASYDIAVKKTFTSASLKMSTEKLGKLCRPGEPLYGIQYTNGGNLVIFGGGEILVNGEKIVGALGVSGGTTEQDIALAAYGKEAYKEVLACL